MKPLLKGPAYPSQQVRVVPFAGDLLPLFQAPTGLFESTWPPQQLIYLGGYLTSIGCKSVVIEHHYIDRDFMSDLAAFYSRSLRSYPNFCIRLHFFSAAIDDASWRQLIVQAGKGEFEKSQATLNASYLGYSVIRPLAGSPVGRTVLKPFPAMADLGQKRRFDSARDYSVHLAGFKLNVVGLAFQQQDKGVSACATTALWVAMHKTAPLEQLAIPTPAEITDAASRYNLPGGRSLPSEGLTLGQICEATRASGLAPLVVQESSLEADRAQILGYCISGFPVLFALENINNESDHHALCCVGVKLGDIQPQTAPNLHFRDAATALKDVYVHDDRLGPYASATLFGHTVAKTGAVRTALSIEAELWLLTALIVPVPLKLRLTIARMRVLGTELADTLGSPRVFPKFSQLVSFNCRYSSGANYQRACYDFKLTSAGLRKVTSGIAMSRYIGLLEFFVPEGPLFDVLLDATETRANPTALACIRREGLPPKGGSKIATIAQQLGVPYIE